MIWVLLFLPIILDLSHLEEELEVLKKEHDVEDNKRLAEIRGMDRTIKTLSQEKEDLNKVKWD